MCAYNNFVTLSKFMLVNIVIISYNISTMHVCLHVYKTVVTSLGVCVHGHMSTSESWFNFNHVVK